MFFRIYCVFIYCLLSFLIMFFQGIEVLGCLLMPDGGCLVPWRRSLVVRGARGVVGLMQARLRASPPNHQAPRSLFPRPLPTKCNGSWGRGRDGGTSAVFGTRNLVIAPEEFPILVVQSQKCPEHSENCHVRLSSSGSVRLLSNISSKERGLS